MAAQNQRDLSRAFRDSCPGPRASGASTRVRQHVGSLSPRLSCSGPAVRLVVTRVLAVAAVGGGARLPQASSVALGSALCRWRFLEDPAQEPAAFPEARGPGGSSETGLGPGRLRLATGPFSVSAPARCSSEDKITVHFLNRDGEILTTKGKVGASLLHVVVENNLDIDGFGACEGTLACSTCHLIFEKHMYEKLDAITGENDMLDLAYGLTDRSQLGCQVCLTKSMDKMTVQVPDAMADAGQSVDMGKNS